MPMLSIDATSIAITCGACPTIFTAREIETGDDVKLHFRYWVLTVTRGYTDVFSRSIKTAEGEGFCSFEAACRAADIAVVDPATGEEIDPANADVANEQ